MNDFPVADHPRRGPARRGRSWSPRCPPAATCSPSRSRSASRSSPLGLAVAHGAAVRRRRRASSSSSRPTTWIPQFGVQLRRSASTASRWSWSRSPTVLVPVVHPGVAGTTSTSRPAQRQGLLRAAARCSRPSMIGVFAATDVFLFYVFFEAMLIPVYFLIGGFGGAAALVRRGEVPAVLSSLGGLLMLAAVIGLYVVSADAGHAGVPHSATCRRCDIEPDHRAAGCSSASSSPSRSRRRCSRCTPGCRTPRRGDRRRRACCWSACSTRSAPSGCCASACALFPDASQWATPVVLVLAVISIVYGALLAIGQNDIKRLIAYTSMSPLRLHRARHLRADQPGPVRRDRSTWSTTASRPPRCSSSPAS